MAVHFPDVRFAWGGLGGPKTMKYDDARREVEECEDAALPPRRAADLAASPGRSMHHRG